MVLGVVTIDTLNLSHDFLCPITGLGFVCMLEDLQTYLRLNSFYEAMHAVSD